LSTIPGTATLAHVLRHRPTDAKRTPKSPSIELLRIDNTGNPHEVTTGYAQQEEPCSPGWSTAGKKCKRNIHTVIPSPATASLTSNPSFSPPRANTHPFPCGTLQRRIALIGRNDPWFGCPQCHQGHRVAARCPLVHKKTRIKTHHIPTSIHHRQGGSHAYCDEHMPHGVISSRLCPRMPSPA